MNINFKRPPAVCPRQTSRHVQYLEQNELFHPSDDDHSLRELLVYSIDSWFAPVAY